MSTSSNKSSNVVWHTGELSREDRFARLGGGGGTLWLTGLSGSGKSTIAAALERTLVERGRYAYRLDGDNIRHGLNGDLGFSAADRVENIRRIGEVSLLFADSGCLAITSFISPYRLDRDGCRRRHRERDLPFLEVFVDTPMEECERRDPKGLYARARKGEIRDFTGVDAPYEVPLAPELHLKTVAEGLDVCVERCLGLLSDRGLI